uniref:ABC transporter domain-containing protein n=1 Tax=Emiliania huxleyi TaxID=2903 RepID=A0A7S3TRD2_EMIHU
MPDPHPDIPTSTRDDTHSAVSGCTAAALAALAHSREALSTLHEARSPRTVPRVDAPGFPATAQRKPVSALSGGERTRLCIASMLLSRANLLVLDEPTNHLDLRAREYLGDALRSFDGAVLLVSHDRAFAAHVATRVAELRGGRLHAEQGDYRAYIERRDELRARIDRRAVSAGLPAEGGERGGTDGASSDRPSKRAARRRRSSR